GDELLCIASNRILSAVRIGDIVFRMGGDEFLLLLPDAGPEDCAFIGARLVSAMAQPIQLSGGQTVSVGASVGSASACEIRQSPEIVLDAADAALYRAKATGKGRHEHAEAIAA